VVDFVPSAEVEKKGFQYNPNISVTVKSDVEKLNNQLQNGEITKDVFEENIKKILPNFDADVYNKTKLFGLERGDLSKLEYTTILAAKEEENQLHNNKMNYINSQVPKGDTVSNTGMGLSDWKLQDDLSRSELFMTRKKKFLDKYPQGAYTLLTLNAYGDEPIELFKKDKEDTEWQFRLPYGRDVGEFGVATAAIFNTRNLGAAIAAYVSPPTGLRSFGTLVAGDYLGQQTGKTIEQLKGYGEGEFEGEAGVGTLKNYFNNLFAEDFGMGRDVKEAFGVGGSQIFLNRIMNYFTRKDKSLFGLFGLAKGADRYNAAFEDLIAAGYNVDPIVHAQLLSWPLLRASFFQAKDFVKFPRETLGAQSSQLYKQFEKFGVDLGGTGDKLNFGQLVQLNKRLEADLGNLLKVPTNAVEKTNLQQQILKLTKKWDETSTAIEQQMKLSAGQMARTEGINFNIGGVKRAARKWQKEFNVTGAGLKYTQKEIDDAAALGINLKPRKVKIQGTSGSSELDTLLLNITKLDDTLIRQRGGKNWSEVTDQLLSLRKQALALTTHSDASVRASAREIFDQIKKSSKRANGATEEFGVVWNQYNKMLDEHDLIRQTMAMKKAVSTGDLDAATFANQFLDPRLPDTSSLLMKIVPEEQLPNIQAAFISNMTRDPKQMGKMLDNWLENNPEGLKNLIGASRIKELQAMKVITDQFDNSIVQRALNEGTEFTPVEFIKFVQRTAEKEGLGAEKAVLKLIDDFGGMNSPQMNELRSGIINNILRKATDKGAKDIYDAAGEKTIDPAKFFVELEKLTDDKVLSKLFTKEHREIIQNFDLYTQAISSMEDVGGKIAAAEQRSKIMTGIVDPKGLVGVTKTILGYTLMSRVLGSPITAAKISDLGPPGTEKFILGMRNILAEVLADLAVTPAIVGPVENVKEGITIDFAPSSVTPGKQSIINKVIESEEGAFPGSQQDLKNLEKERDDAAAANISIPDQRAASVIPEGSRLNQGLIDRNRAAIAFGPNDMLAQPRMVAQGGIMNATKPIQRVA
jgi:hypothetical protein